MRAMLVDGRPCRMPKQLPRSRISQQDVYAMLKDPSFDPEGAVKIEEARKRAELRARRQVALQRREAQQAEERRVKAEAEANAKERERLLRIFGLSNPDAAQEEEDADAEVAATLLPRASAPASVPLVHRQ